MIAGWGNTQWIEMLVFQIDRNYPRYVIKNIGAPRQGSYL